MSYPFVGPVEVPTPAAGSHPTTKTYVDTELATKADAGHNHDATYATTGHSHTHPLVPNPPVTLAYAASLTPAAGDGNYRVVTATGDLTLNPPTGGTDGQLLRLRFIASTATRTVTFAAGFRRPSTIGSTLVIATGKRGDVGLAYEAADGWTVLASQAQA